MKYIPILFLLTVSHLSGQNFNYNRLSIIPASYQCNHIEQNKIKCDGKINEPEWQHAKWSDLFADIEGPDLPKPWYPTRVKLLWDDAALYVAAELKEDHIWAYQNTRDDIIYRENDFEVFISGDIENPEYYEIEINALNNILDLLLAKPYRDGGKPDLSWDVKSMETGVDIQGTINDATDLDNRWTVEIKIPFQSLAKNANGMLPLHGTIWRINFSRVEYDVEIQDNHYYRKKNEAGKLIPEHNWVWSPQGLIDMHFPERWGYLIFNKAPAHKTSATTRKFKRTEAVKSVLWMIYYKQRSYFREHQKYASDLTILDYPEFLESSDLPELPLILTPTQSGYEVLVDLPAEKLHFSLDHTGIIR